MNEKMYNLLKNKIKPILYWSMIPKSDKITFKFFMFDILNAKNEEIKKTEYFIINCESTEDYNNPLIKKGTKFDLYVPKKSFEVGFNAFCDDFDCTNYNNTPFDIEIHFKRINKKSLIITYIKRKIHRNI